MWRRPLDEFCSPSVAAGEQLNIVGYDLAGGWWKREILLTEAISFHSSTREGRAVYGDKDH